jgi:hypothetical protein
MGVAVCPTAPWHEITGWWATASPAFKLAAENGDTDQRFRIARTAPNNTAIRLIALERRSPEYLAQYFEE